MEPVLISRDGQIATVALHNPGKLNALHKAMWQRLGEVMRELSADDGLRCIDGFLILVLLRVRNAVRTEHTEFTEVYLNLFFLSALRVLRAKCPSTI